MWEKWYYVTPPDKYRPILLFVYTFGNIYCFFPCVSQMANCVSYNTIVVRILFNKHLNIYIYILDVAIFLSLVRDEKPLNMLYKAL